MANGRNPSSSKPNKRFVTAHPYAAIEHRVIDSPAFADLRPSSVVLLVILARQLTRDNNGHLQATWKYCKARGIGSENTLRDAIRDLISHGLIYRSRSRGPNRAWARYAVTWLPIKRREGLFLEAWLPEAWKTWEEKSTPKKLEGKTPRTCSLTAKKPPETDGSIPSESDDYELVPFKACVEEVV
jgi:hypothetical protein